ncbi:DJ-1/PfpI family protein [Paraburkholderia bengalensis]|uniref:DJ-1/PfpI family protein n=1 Tax=Paraburkholderia bengalensis TaxID=2747562 RepID=UPI003014FFBA
MKRIKIGMVVFPGFQLLDIAGPRDAFAEVRILSGGQCEYEMLTVGTTRGTVQSSSGLTVTPDRTIFDVCPDFDTVIVPGGVGIFDAFDDPALSEWLRQQYRRVRRVCAICNGVFALGPPRAAEQSRGDDALDGRAAAFGDLPEGAHRTGSHLRAGRRHLYDGRRDRRH